MVGKLKKYSDIKHFPNVIESNYLGHDPVKLSTYWKDYRANGNKKITLELGCGKGDYTTNLGRKYPERYFIGVDIKGARLWKGANIALEEQLRNILFLRIQIEFLACFFPENCIDEIWITFPDPHPKKPGKNSHKRLTSPFFLDIYRKILQPDGTIHLKTDSTILYDFTLTTINDISASLLSYSNDLYNSEITNDPVLFQTAFEKKYLAQLTPIKYVCFCI